jgi:hypothetical protein
MRRSGYVIVLLIVATLLPMWFVGMQGEPGGEEIAIDQGVSELRPLDGFVDTPNKLSPSQVGVIVWVALFVLVGVIAAAHRFMNWAVRPPDRSTGTDQSSAAVADGGERSAGAPEAAGASQSDPRSDGDERSVGTRGPSEPRSDGGRVGLPWLSTNERWVVEYDDATQAIEGLVVMGGLTVIAIVFAALFTGEYLTLARTQYFGVYAAGMFLSLAGSTVAYYAWFMPHVVVAERRDH